MKRAENGPVAGDRVMFCQHAIANKRMIDISPNATKWQPFHWFFLGENEALDRRTGETKPVRWLTLCNLCTGHSAAQGVDPVYLATQDARWIGEPPKITPIIVSGRPN